MIIQARQLTIWERKDGRCTISENEIWLPGCYENKQLALEAFDQPNEVLQSMQDEAIATTKKGIVNYPIFNKFKNLKKDQT